MAGLTIRGPIPT